jgi:hypothetical protein
VQNILSKHRATGHTHKVRMCIYIVHKHKSNKERLSSYGAHIYVKGKLYDRDTKFTTRRTGKDPTRKPPTSLRLWLLCLSCCPRRRVERMAVGPSRPAGIPDPYEHSLKAVSTTTTELEPATHSVSGHASPQGGYRRYSTELVRLRRLKGFAPAC